MDPRATFEELIKIALDRGISKRQRHINENGVDPKTGLTHRVMQLSHETRPRGGKDSRRKTTRIWRTAK